MSQDNDPVGNGSIATLGRPGGNITGLASLRSELNGKRMEPLKEIVPSLSRVVVLGSSTNPGNAQSVKETELAAGAFGVQLEYLDVKGARDIDAVFRQNKGRADAVLVMAGPVFYDFRMQIVEIAVKPASSDIRQARFCRNRRTYELRHERSRFGSPHCSLC
jgi:putative ABC transport system substrate-binding protein